MQAKYLLGVDFGGGASKATLLSAAGKVVAVSVKEYPTYYPREGWTEQNPEEIYESFVSNARQILRESGINAKSIVALCLDAATHTAVLLDEKDKVIRNAIYWTDKRCIKESDYLLSNYTDLIMKLSYNTPSPVWTLPQLMWLKEHEPSNFNRIHKILFVKDYIRSRLTGDFVTDSIEAMGSMLMDVERNCWSRELCSLAGIEESVLPEIVDPGAVVGRLTESAVKETGLSTNTLVIAGAPDTVMEVFASGAIRPGQATIKLATAGRICPVTEKAYPSPHLINYRHIVPGMWYPGTATKSCAASYRWYRDVMGTFEMETAKQTGADPYDILTDAAASVSAGSNNLFFHPYLQGELTPYLDNSLRGSFTGISSFHSKAHFNRAVLEGVAYSLLDCFLTIRDLKINIERASVIGGGAKSVLWRQILSDMLGIELVKTENDDSSLGSAMFAGVVTGIFSSFEDSIERCVHIKHIITPDPKTHEIYNKGFAVYKKIQKALAPIYHDLA